MATDLQLPLRLAVVVALKNDAAVSAIVGTRVHVRPSPDQVWPFVRYGVPLVRPMTATGIDGSEVDLMIHSFSAGETEDECADLSRAVAEALDGKVLTLGTEGKCQGIRWTGTQILGDTARADGWHGLISFTATIVS
jgi:hypothetical protein